ncbi:MAG: alpha/beta fold hydrolase [Planctomycetes bacterium]|nr:alpha/beta fold hydrolase [Planctomycetota bacterium]
MFGDLVRMTASDGLRLDGSLHRSAKTAAKAPTDAVILLHGVGGNFYSSSLLEAFLDPLMSRGVAVLRVNTRGHDGLFTAKTNQGPRRFGAAYEIVDECRLDIAAWREFLLEQGFARIALAGHSLGAIKAVYAAAHAPAETFARIAALSPPRLSYQLFRKGGDTTFRKTISVAECCVEDGRPEELMQVRFPVPLVISAASYVDKYGRQERYDILKHIPKLPCPALFLYGAKELAGGGAAFAGMDRLVAEAAREGQSLTVRAIPDADHFYNGVQAAAAEAAAQWLCK